MDIAGIVEGASKGEGLGNKFLSHIREVDAILQVVRCFEDDDITHVSGDVSPLSDIEIIETELLLADMETLATSLPKSERAARGGDKDAKLRVEVTKKCQACVDAASVNFSVLFCPIGKVDVLRRKSSTNQSPAPLPLTNRNAELTCNAAAGNRTVDVTKFVMSTPLPNWLSTKRHTPPESRY